ncbi:MAG: UTP--glucose-1-phosphate uridylyltransferase [Myxococcaceae bacterium]
MKSIKKAVFPIAGSGTRALKICSKEMLPIMGKSLLMYAVEEAIQSGIEEFIFVTRDGHAPDYFQQFQGVIAASQIRCVSQEQPLGLGHAVYCARSFIDDEFFVVSLPDELILCSKPCLQQMLEAHEKTLAGVVALYPVPREQITQYGIVGGEETDIPSLLKLTELIEKPNPANAPSSLAVVGRYILNSSIFSYLETQQPGAQGEIQLTDSLHSVLKEETLYGLAFNGQRFDCGSREGYLSVVSSLPFAREAP